MFTFTSLSVSWIWLAILSAVFAGATSVIAKAGLKKMDSTVATALRTIVVLLFCWMIVSAKGTAGQMTSFSHTTWIFLILSGVATGASWLCYYYALQNGPASAVVPIDKLSILVTIVFSYFVFHEKLSRRACIGLCFIVAGTLALALL